MILASPTLAEVFLRPALPPALIAVTAAGLLALAVAASVRSRAGEGAFARWGLLAMRALAIVALASVLLGPSEIPPTVDREERPKVTILADVSESMRTVDCDGRARFEAMVRGWLDAGPLTRIAEVADIDLRAVGTATEPVARGSLAGLPADAAAAPESNLLAGIVDALGDAVGEAPGAGRRILILSDGRDTSGASAVPAIELARSRGVPVDTVSFGAAVLRRDLAVQAAPAQEFLYGGEEGSIVVRLQQTGLALGEVEVELAVQGPEGASRTTRVADLRGRTVAELRVPVRHEKPGQYQYALRVAARPEEIDVANNAQTLFLDVTKAKARVLLLEGQPTWDMKFVAQALRKDPRVELTQVSRLSPKRTEVIVSGAPKGEGDGKEPATRGRTAADVLAPEALATIDVFVLGRNIDAFTSPEQVAAIRDRVAEHGAGVLLLRGRPYAAAASSFATALAPIEPVVFAASAPIANARIVLAPSAATTAWLAADRLGVDLAAGLDELAPWPTLLPVEGVRPATIVLARAIGSGATGSDAGADEANPPAIVTMRAGKGISAAFLGEGLWRWALVDHDHARFEGMYERMVQGLVRWIAAGGDERPGQDVTLRLGAQSAKLGDAVPIEVRLERPIDPAPREVTLSRPDGGDEVVPLSPSLREPLRLEGSFRVERPGVHVVTLSTPGHEPATQARYLNAFDPSVERINLSADPIAMRTIAERTGGAVFGPDEAGRYPEHVRRRRFATIASQEATWVWNRVPILFMLCTWLGLEWILRRRAGLP